MIDHPAGDPKRRAALQAPSLSGRTVFIVGSRFYTGGLHDELHAAGARVIYPVQMDADALTERQDAIAVAHEILNLEPKPDAVIVHHPRMNLHDGRFADTPAIELAQTLKPHGIPTLILDHFRDMDAASAVITRQAGARFFNLREFRVTDAVSVIAQMVAASPHGTDPNLRR